MLFSPQIPLQLEPPRPDRFDAFVPGPNSAALLAVQNQLAEPGSSLFLSGPEGSGKSHLLNALCHDASERGMNAFYIALKRLPESAAAGLEGLQVLDVVCVDDIERVAGNPVWERALFRCFNEVLEAGGRLLVASRLPLASLEFDLPDLASRLAWGVRQNLQYPDDAGKREILLQRARNLHFDLDEDVCDYMLKHGRRDMASLLGTLEQLKDAAFVAKRRITVPLAREVMKQNGGQQKQGSE